MTITALDSPATDTSPACTAEEARELARQAREALVSFDTAMQQIVARRAWEPLGYPSPREFVIAELGPGAEGTDGRVSRAHAYRLARVASFLYGLVQRLGEDAAVVDLSERALRAIPSGPDGANDTIVLDRVQQRLDQLVSYDDEDAQRIVTEEVSRAREELASTGTLTPEAPGLTNLQYVTDPVDDPLAQVGEDDQGDAGNLDAVDEGAEDVQEEVLNNTSEVGEPTSSRSSLAAAYAPASVSAEQAAASAAYVQMLAALTTVTEVAPHLPGIMDFATDDELQELHRTADIAVKVCTTIRETADELR